MTCNGAVGDNPVRGPGLRGGPFAAAMLVVWLVPVAVASDRAAPQARLLSKQAIPVLYNQGIARVRGGWILSGTLSPIPDTDALVRTDEHFNVLVTNKPAIPPEWRARGYDHIGDIDVVGNVVYAPFEQPDYTKGQQVTARYDARTLRFLAAVVVPQHENSFVAVDPATRIAWSMDHFDGNELLRYDVARSWKRLPPLRLSTVLHHTQGAERHRRCGLDLDLRSPQRPVPGEHEDGPRGPHRPDRGSPRRGRGHRRDTAPVGRTPRHGPRSRPDQGLGRALLPTLGTAVGLGASTLMRRS